MVPGDVHLQLETAPHRVFKREDLISITAALTRTWSNSIDASCISRSWHGA